MLHLIKLSVGPESLADLQGWQTQRLAERRQRGLPAEINHITRQMPKRTTELLDGGSIYWVIKGWLCARQPLLDLRAVTIDGVPHCALVLAPELVRVVPRRHRPFQGWRYLQAGDAPRDLPPGAEPGQGDEAIARELSALGLL